MREWGLDSMSAEYRQRMQWIKSLQVGDEVCDCRYRHLAIQEIVPQYYPWMPWVIRHLIFADWMPQKLSDWLDTQWDRIARRLHLTRLYDYDLVLEDGSGCSAFHCCTPADHTVEEHPKQEET